MLRDTEDFKDYGIGATDGPIGQVDDLYFDDQTWVIRYLVVETGHWLSNRKVLISPIAVEQSDRTDKVLRVALSRHQVRHSPDVDTHRPVSRQQEMDNLAYYGYPAYWDGAALWGEVVLPWMLRAGPAAIDASNTRRVASERSEARARVSRALADDPRLRSCNAVTGYHVQATDGEIGHLASLLVDDETWAVRFLIVKTSNWWLGYRVMIPVNAVDRVSWDEEMVMVELSRQQIKDAHVYDAATLPRDSDEAARIHDR